MFGVYFLLPLPSPDVKWCASKPTNRFNGPGCQANARDPLRTYARRWRICKVAEVGEEMVGTGWHLHSRKKIRLRRGQSLDS